MTRGKIRVLIVDDSAVVRQLLEHTINRDPRLAVVGQAASAEAALEMLPRLEPDLVTMDIRLPGMNGFEATRRIMVKHPRPIVVVAADVADADLDIARKALRAGALTVVEKPGGVGRADYEDLARHLCTQLVIMSTVPVVRQRSAHRLPLPSAHRRPPDWDGFRHPPDWGGFRHLALVASTGGPNALRTVLNGLPPTFPLPITIVQHIGAGFVAAFASWLGQVCPFPVSLARPGERPRPGHVYVAPGDVHLALEGQGFRLSDGDLVCGQRPSGDVLFASMSRTVGPGAIGVLLTGMGADGAQGLLALRREGAHTIAEDATTAVIHGMPRVAVALGAAVEHRPLHTIPPRILSLIGVDAAEPNRHAVP